MASFDLSARQAQAILDMRLAKLTGLEREALVAEIEEVGALIAQLEEILGSEAVLMAVVVAELEEVKARVRRRAPHRDRRRSTPTSTSRT